MYFKVHCVRVANYAKLQQKLDSIYFLNKTFFTLLIFEVAFISKNEEDNSYLFDPSWIETKYERKHFQWENSFIHIQFIQLIKKN